MHGLKIFVVLLGWLSLPAATDSMKIVCYWQSILSADVIPDLCTHIIYAFIGVNEDGGLFYISPQAPQKIAALNELRSLNPDLRVMAAIGGASDEFASAFATFSNSHESRSKFVSEVVKFVREHSLSGIDVDWEFPSAADSNNFVLLLRDLKSAFDQFNYTLSVAVAPDKWRAKSFYNIEQISQIVDFINLMTYDFHGAWDKTVGHHAQMYPHLRDSDYMSEVNCAASVVYWLRNKANPEKLVFGIPTYGNVFTLMDPDSHRIGTNVNTSVTTRSTMGYDEYCRVKSSGWKQHFDVNFRVYYATRGSSWFGFDSQRQIVEKVKFAKSLKLGGIMFWSIDTDDYANNCKQGRFALISAARDEAKK